MHETNRIELKQTLTDDLEREVVAFLNFAKAVSLKQQAIAKHFLGGEFIFEKMNFFERSVIKRIAKTDKSVSRIDEDGIEKFVTDFIKQK
jgi:menaquinone-dependent protoporphyrinogen oxidase